MKILMLVNWKVEYLNTRQNNLQPPDYYIKGEPYWFFKHWQEEVEVDVIDIGSSWFTKNIEKKILKFYILQTFKALPKLKKYDVIMSHGVQSAIFLSLIRRIFKIKKPKHIVFDIGSFNSARETGLISKFMRMASKSIDGIIYHTGSQIDYYKKYFPWITNKSIFIPFGTDPDYFDSKDNVDEEKCVICVGYSKRDWETLINAFKKITRKDVYLKIVGRTDLKINESDDNIILKPFIPIKELIREIKSSMFVVLPLESFNYSYGQMTLLQGMSLGKATIAARVPSLLDYVKDNETALFYESGDVNSLTSKLELLLENEELRRQIGQMARTDIENVYNEKEMTNKIYDFVKIIGCDKIC